MSAPETLLPLHGGYRKLKSFQLAQLCYDITVRFADRYIEKRSRTHDQMVQAARSGVQNIAEGSKASGTSKKMEIKLTNVARAKPQPSKTKAVSRSGCTVSVRRENIVADLNKSLSKPPPSNASTATEAPARMIAAA